MEHHVITPPQVVQYEAIFQLLCKSRRTPDERAQLKKQLACTDGAGLREFNTIGFTTPRQTGKTDWLASRLKDPAKNAVVFTKNLGFRDTLIERSGADDRVFVWIPDTDLQLADLPEDLEYIFVDDHHYTFMNGNMGTSDPKAFYDWVASLGLPDVTVVLVG